MMTTSRPRASQFDGVVRARCGSPPAGAADEIAPARSAQISSCSSAPLGTCPQPQRARCGRASELLEELADRRRLAGAVDADDEVTVGLASSATWARRRRAARSPRQAPRRGRPVRHGLRRRDDLGRRATPTSPWMSASSSRSHASSSAASKVPAAISAVSARRLFASQSRRRPKKPVGSGSYVRGRLVAEELCPGSRHALQRSRGAMRPRPRRQGRGAGDRQAPRRPSTSGSGPSGRVRSHA